MTINLSSLNKVVLIGIGGERLFYIARFLKLLGKEVEGYDYRKSDKTKTLESLGIKTKYRNPEPNFNTNADLIIFSAILPERVIAPVLKFKKVKKISADSFFRKLSDDYQKSLLSSAEKKAFVRSEIAPLFKIDYSKMVYIGVTGTDGKTTTSTMIYQILKETGFKPGIITTVSAKIGSKEIDTGFHVTTPPAQQVFNFLKKMEKSGCTHAIIEATSHGLAMGRLTGLKFDLAVYTNITKEHLDFHKTWQGVVRAKSLLITKHLKKEGLVILNQDDRSFEHLLKISPKKLTYSQKTNRADFFAEKIKLGRGKMSFSLTSTKKKISKEPVLLNIIGRYNISNALAAISATSSIGVKKEKIISGLRKFKTVKGRMEIVQKDPFYVIVDFAHTPSGLKQALKSVVRLKKTVKNKLIAVFGCAGKRDPYKRYAMGKISGKFADLTILTAEDPRTESLKEINDQIEKGWKDGSKRSHRILRFDHDDQNVKVRKNAIKKALSVAQSGDVVIICGKAHEKSLCFGATEYLWNDIEETKKLLKKN